MAGSTLQNFLSMPIYSISQFCPHWTPNLGPPLILGYRQAQPLIVKHLERWCQSYTYVWLYCEAIYILKLSNAHKTTNEVSPSYWICQYFFLLCMNICWPNNNVQDLKLKGRKFAKTSQHLFVLNQKANLWLGYSALTPGSSPGNGICIFKKKKIPSKPKSQFTIGRS